MSISVKGWNLTANMEIKLMMKKMVKIVFGLNFEYFFETMTMNFGHSHNMVKCTKVLYIQGQKDMEAELIT